MNPLERPDQAFRHTDMGGPVGEASGRTIDRWALIFPTPAGVHFRRRPPIPLTCQMIAVRSLEERFAHVRVGQ